MVRVIYNPAAGPRIVRKIDRVAAALARRGSPHEVVRTAKPGHATRIAADAAREGVDAVVAVGGDGTVNEVANGLAGTPTRLVLVPHGTGNVLARELRLPPSVERCVALLDDGVTLDIPLARAGDRYFVLLASAGFDAEVVERMGRRGKRLLGIAAYGLAGVRHLLRPQPTLWLEFPGRERIEAQAALVCRGRTYGGGVTMAPGGSLTRNALHVVAPLRPGRASLLRFVYDAWRGTHAASPRVLVRETEWVLARSRIPSAAQVDGDYLGPLPVRFETTDVPLRLVVPRDFPVREAI